MSLKRAVSLWVVFVSIGGKVLQFETLTHKLLI